MVSFESDYIQGAHEKILARFIETNSEKMPAYGTDKYCESAKQKIRRACQCEDAEVYFLCGGTQTNAVVIDSLLTGYQGVIAADTGHVNTHEAGAIEYTGHKVLTLPNHSGKIICDELEGYLERFWNDENREHMVFPGMVYISHPTEYGALYSKAELEELAKICRRYGIPLYMDGARLAYALASRETDVTLADIARLCDVFYIGGTKAGALFGEAVVFTKSAPRYFMTIVKQHGALLAKGWLLGLQFDTLFTDGLYFEIGRHAIEMSERLKEGFRAKGCEFYLESPTNQQFIILTDGETEKLKGKAALSFWERLDGSRAVYRFAASWSTTERDVTELLALLS